MITTNIRQLNNNLLTEQTYFEYDQYLKNKGWNYNICNCGKEYYHKDNDNICGHSKCTSPQDPINKLNNKNIITTPEELISKYKKFFSESNAMYLEPINLNSAKNTLLVGAGIQTLETKLYEKESKIPDTYYVLQPTIRAHSKNKINTKKGISISFTSIGLESINADSKKYVKDLDSWLNFLAAVHFPLTKLHLFPKQNWDGKKFHGKSLTAYIGNLQIFDAVFVHQLPEDINYKANSLSDIGSSVERILWILNKTTKHFEAYTGYLNIRELSEKNSELLRAMTLLSLNKVSPNNKGTGYIFRSLANEYVSNKGTLAAESLIKEHYNYWNMIQPEGESLNNITDKIISELSRCAIQEMKHKYNITSTNKETTNYNNFIKTLLKNNPKLINSIFKK